MKHVFLTMLLLVGVRAAAEPLTISEHKDRNEANGTTPRIGQPFDIVGQVALVCDEHPRRITLIDRDHPESICILDTSPTANYRDGDLIRVQGVYTNDIAGYKRQVPSEILASLTNLQIVGHEDFPPTHPGSADDINTPRKGTPFIHVDGIIASVIKDSSNVEWNWLLLRTDTGLVRAAATEKGYPFETLHALLDADVQLRGIVTQPGIRLKSRGNHLILYGSNGLRVTQPPPAPFTAPRLRDTDSPHRQQTSGRVVGANNRCLFVRDDKNRFLSVVPANETVRPSLGDRILISGFVDTTPLGLRISGAVFRPDAPQPATDAEPDPVDPERLFTTSYGDAIIDTSRYGQLIRVRGRVANSPESIRTDGKILLECNKRSITADVAHMLTALDNRIGTDYIVELTGLCLFDFGTDPVDSSFPQFKGFVIVPRTAEDIVIVRRPPWWTVGKLLCVIAVLVLGLVAVFIWNRMLKVLSERRGRELAEEQITSARADLKVEERTRLAVELHDSISQTLTGVALQIDAAQGSGRSNPTAAAKFLENARAMLASCRQELRCCIWDLKSRTFEEKDITEALQKTLAPHINEANLYVRFNVPRAILSESSAHDILRIVRELVINAIRHGHAKNIRIAGECRDGTVRFAVRDDGSGFSEADVPGPSQGHFGLQGIRERIGNRNGELAIDSAPGQGTKVTVSFLADEKDEDEA